MFKSIIAPVQAWLLSRGQCVGCGMPLTKAKRTAASAKGGSASGGKPGLEKVTCKCGRIFIYDTKKGAYRRALFDEI